MLLSAFALRPAARRAAPRHFPFPFFAGTLLGLAVPFTALDAAPAPAPSAESPVSEEKESPDSADSAESGEITSLAAYNVKADRIEDFGLRVQGTMYHVTKTSKPNIATIWFYDFAPIVTSVLPNTAAAKAGLQPGEFILKSEGRSTVGGPFSTGKFGSWYKTQRKKWAEVASGKTNVVWTLEVESPGTRAVRTVRLIVPTPAPHWGSAIWQPPAGRAPSTVNEPGPLAALSRTVLDNGVPFLFDGDLVRFLGLDPAMPTESRPVGYSWTFGTRAEGQHRIIVTQVRGRTDVIFEAAGSRINRHLFLTSPSGALEKSSRTKRDDEHIEIEAARTIFANELDLWTTKIEKVTGRWPFELKPDYDSKAIFPSLAAKPPPGAPPAPPPLAAEFLKLTPATTEQQALFTEAYGKLGAEPDQWAYTEKSHTPEDSRTLVMRRDPSKPDAERCVLLTIDGKPPTTAELQRWHDEGGDLPKPMGDIPPLGNLIDAKDLRIVREEAAAIVFEAPIRAGASFPSDKFQALFRVNKTYRSFEDITVRLRDSLSVAAGVVKVTEAGLQLRFQTLDPAHPPQPTYLRSGGTARILLMKISRDFELTRTDFKRVSPYVAPDPDALTPPPITLPLPAKP